MSAFGMMVPARLLHHCTNLTHESYDDAAGHVMQDVLVKRPGLGTIRLIAALEDVNTNEAMHGVALSTITACDLSGGVTLAKTAHLPRIVLVKSVTEITEWLDGIRVTFSTITSVPSSTMIAFRAASSKIVAADICALVLCWPSLMLKSS